MPVFPPAILKNRQATGRARLLLAAAGSSLVCQPSFKKVSLGVAFSSELASALPVNRLASG